MLLFIEKNSISSYLQCYELQKETKEGQERSGHETNEKVMGSAACCMHGLQSVRNGCVCGGK